MFKWTALGVGAAFLAAVLWMINDIRLQVRRSGEVVERAGGVVNKELPDIVRRSKDTSEVVSKSLPQVVERVDRTTEVVAELAEDIKQMKELAGLGRTPRDKGVVAYADSVLKFIESSGGEIGTKKTVGSGLKNTRSAADWVREERREAVFVAVLGKSKAEMLRAIATTKLGFAWYIQMPDRKPVKLLDWLKENHAESKAL